MLPPEKERVLQQMKSLPPSDLRRCTQQALDNLLPRKSLQDDKETSSVDSSEYVRIMEELVILAAKENMTQEEFGQLAERIGLPSSDILLGVGEKFTVVKEHLRKVLTSKSQGSDLVFNHLDWRMETEVCKSHIYQQYLSDFTLRLSFTNGKSKVGKASPATIVRMKEVCEEALSEGKSYSVQRLLRRLR